MRSHRTSPPIDHASIFDAHVKAEFVDHDVDATIKTMVAEPYLLHVPTLAGGAGATEVRHFYKRDFVGKWPADTRVSRISRTVGDDQIVDELMLSFTHDAPLAFMLPGVPPTGKRVELPVVVVMKFENDKIVHEHIYWDQASLLVQVGLLDSQTLPVVGVEQARALSDPSLPLNILLKEDIVNSNRAHGS
ncbi:MAG TPA: ester cyclase [Nitrospiraceae bacterium]|nr:ester cyclase [Nitrospiraceae bacterium]